MATNPIPDNYPRVTPVSRDRRTAAAAIDSTRRRSALTSIDAPTTNDMAFSICPGSGSASRSEPAGEVGRKRQGSPVPGAPGSLHVAWIVIDQQ